MERAPHQEARLTFFANTPNNSGNPEDEFADDGSVEKMKKKFDMDDMTGAHRRKFANIFNSNTASGPDSETRKETLDMRDIAEGFDVIHEAVSNFSKAHNPVLIELVEKNLSEKTKKMIEENHGNVTEYIDKRFRGSIARFIDNLPEEERVVVEAGMGMIYDSERKIQSWRTISRLLGEWSKGDMKPAAFREFIARMLVDDVNVRKQLLQKIDDALADKEIADSVSSWNERTYTVSLEQKRSIAKKLLETINGEAIEKELAAALEKEVDHWRNVQHGNLVDIGISRARDSALGTASTTKPSPANASNQGGGGGKKGTDRANDAGDDDDDDDSGSRAGGNSNADVDVDALFADLDTASTPTGKSKEDMDRANAEARKKDKALIEKAMRSEPKGESFIEKMKHLRENGIMGITVYTPNEYIAAIKKIAKSFSESNKDYHEGMSNQLASTMTGIIAKLPVPYADAVNRQFVGTVESEFKKANKAFREQLEYDDFDSLLSKLRKLQHDPAKATAILDEFASKGFLYELSDSTQTPTHIFGFEIEEITPKHWTKQERDSYIAKLGVNNTAGGQTRRENTAKKFKEQSDPDLFVDKYTKSLAKNDYWAALGIMDVLHKKGKLPEVGQLLTLSFIEHLRSDDNAKKYMTAPILEQLASFNWGHISGVPNNIVFQLGQVSKLRVQPDQMDGYFLSTIDKVYKMILEADPDLAYDRGSKDKTEIEKKNKLIGIAAKIMAGQIVTVETKNGQKKKLSIFRSQFNDFLSTQKIKGVVRASDYYDGKEILQSEDAYFKSDSGLLLMPAQSFMAVMRTGNSGQLENKAEAKHLVYQAKEKYDSLASVNRDAQDYFADLMRQKFNRILEDITSQKAFDVMLATKLEGGGSLLGSLIARGLIDKTQLDKKMERLKASEQAKNEVNTYYEQGMLRRAS